MAERKPSVHCVLDGNRGVYLPRDFANEVIPLARVSGIQRSDIDILRAGPNHEDYWDAWETVLDNAVIHTGSRGDYTLYQDGDLFIIPVGMEWNDREDGYVWPDDETVESDE